MTAEEIKEKVAKEKGYKDWETCINDQPNYMIEKLMDIVVEEYAQQKQDKSETCIYCKGSGVVNMMNHGEMPCVCKFQPLQ